MGHYLLYHFVFLACLLALAALVTNPWVFLGKVVVFAGMTAMWMLVIIGGAILLGFGHWPV